MSRSYAVKETFYTLQGEGYHTGRAAVFLRFAGCNLWSGRQEDRDRGPGGCSRWCDTDFVGTNGSGGGRFRSPADLALHVANQWKPKGHAHRFVVCTGGEPLLQLDVPLIDALHVHGFHVAIETNGTLPVPRGVDWVCVSPKAGKTGAALVVTKGDELKLVVPQVYPNGLTGADPEWFEGLRFDHFYLQPKDGPMLVENTRAAVTYCLEHPRWRLSLQTHKMIGIA